MQIEIHNLTKVYYEKRGLLPARRYRIFSQKLTAVAPFLPSYQFYEPLKSILLEEGRISNLSLEWIYLLLVGLLTFFFAYLLMKKRWLM